MSNMIDRVEQALITTGYLSRSDDGVEPSCRELAIAAIEAMREFDYSMIHDIQYSLLGIIHMGELTPPQWKQIWQAMIDAALKEQSMAGHDRRCAEGAKQMTMVEKVARAMCEHLETQCPAWDWKIYAPMARAAIEAMRGPTEIIFRELINDGDAREKFIATWNAVIDAALKAEQ